MADPFEIFNQQSKDSDFANFTSIITGVPDLSSLRKEAQASLPQAQYISYLELSKNDSNKFAIGLLSGGTVEKLKEKLAQINELKPQYYDKATNGDQFQKIIYPFLMKQLDMHSALIEGRIVCILEGRCTEGNLMKRMQKRQGAAPYIATTSPVPQPVPQTIPKTSTTAVPPMPIGMTREIYDGVRYDYIRNEKNLNKDAVPNNIGNAESKQKSDNKALIYVGVAIAGILLFNTLKK